MLALLSFLSAPSLKEIQLVLFGGGGGGGGGGGVVVVVGCVCVCVWGGGLHRQLEILSKLNDAKKTKLFTV